MAEFKKITEVDQTEELSENATILAEDIGKLKRVPIGSISSGGTGNFCIITKEEPDGSITASMTYNELLSLINSGEFPEIVVITMEGGFCCSYCFAYEVGNQSDLNIPCIEIDYSSGYHIFYKSDGTFSISDPNNSNPA